MVEDIENMKRLPAPKTLKSLAKADAHRTLDAAGFGSDESDAYHGFSAELAGTRAVQLQGAHIVLFCARRPKYHPAPPVRAAHAFVYCCPCQLLEDPPSYRSKSLPLGRMSPENLQLTSKHYRTANGLGMFKERDHSICITRFVSLDLYHPICITVELLLAPAA